MLRTSLLGRGLAPQRNVGSPVRTNEINPVAEIWSRGEPRARARAAEMENSPDQAPSRAKTKAPEQQPHAPGSQSERAAKRQRGCIKYYMGPARSALAEVSSRDAVQPRRWPRPGRSPDPSSAVAPLQEGDAPAGTSAASDEASPEQMDAAPARTPGMYAGSSIVRAPPAAVRRA